MAFARTTLGSKTIHYFVVLFVFGALYYLYQFTELFGSGSSSYSPEELNTLLQNKESHIVALKKTELTQQGLSRPFLDESQFHVKNWDLKGNTMVRNNDFIRLTSNAPHLALNMFSKMPIEADSFEMELTFHIHNDEVKHGLVGDGLAVWFLDKPSEVGEIFGIRNKFTGLGIMMDTYKNGKRGSFPFINLMLGDGKTFYNKGTDGYETRLAGCYAKEILNPLSKETKMRLIYMKNGYLSIDFNYFGRHEDWQNCVTLTDVKLPHIKYLGLSANTGQLYENVDIIENKIYALYKPNGEFVESIDELNELIKEQNEYESESSSLAEINAKVEEAKKQDNQQQQQRQGQGGRKNRAFKKKLSSQRRRTLSRLKNAEKRIKERERQVRLQKYGDPDATFIKRVFGYILKSIKFGIYASIAVFLLWLIRVIVKTQRQNRKLKISGLLD
ncbi:conserved hypothetical protein [Lodderomyces elongisporus NRRL YB-4239]|uniref:L-type lectin-like domain-containing protein n=1 Tax=Lodderomyces elongisporus (strain ATCC 11503 / CBS 2605 / JCM 1781 / NBRC 1676 / NRRL YB-4239) TaxID=379508 RepID=A5DWX1_LODEL|nr:conserved hypothetical protein [Lodderomyces elongisporus NRRL YB-4239]